MLSFKASLRMFSDHCSLAELSNVFGDYSVGSFSKGDCWRNGKSCGYSLWLFESGDLEADFDNVLATLLDRFESIGKFEPDFVKKCDVDIFCMASSDNGQGGFQISLDLMKRLTRNNISITFDVYPNSD